MKIAFRIKYVDRPVAGCSRQRDADCGIGTRGS